MFFFGISSGRANRFRGLFFFFKKGDARNSPEDARDAGPRFSIPPATGGGGSSTEGRGFSGFLLFVCFFFGKDSPEDSFEATILLGFSGLSSSVE